MTVKNPLPAPDMRASLPSFLGSERTQILTGLPCARVILYCLRDPRETAAQPPDNAAHCAESHRGGDCSWMSNSAHLHPS